MAVIDLFKLYFNPQENRYINATEFAYNAVYRQQGFYPAGCISTEGSVQDVTIENSSAETAENAETRADIQGRGSATDNGTINRTGKRRKSS